MNGIESARKDSPWSQAAIRVHDLGRTSTRVLSLMCLLIPLAGDAGQVGYVAGRPPFAWYAFCYAYVMLCVCRPGTHDSEQEDVIVPSAIHGSVSPSRHHQAQQQHQSRAGRSQDERWSGGSAGLQGDDERWQMERSGVQGDGGPWLGTEGELHAEQQAGEACRRGQAPTSGLEPSGAEARGGLSRLRHFECPVCGFVGDLTGIQVLQHKRTHAAS